MSGILGHLETIETGNQETETEEIQDQEKTGLQVENMSLLDMTAGHLEILGHTMIARGMTEDLGIAGHREIMDLQGKADRRGITDRQEKADHTHPEMKDREIWTDQNHHRVMNHGEAVILTGQVEIMALHQTIKVLIAICYYMYIWRQFY